MKAEAGPDNETAASGFAIKDITSLTAAGGVATCSCLRTFR